MTETPSTKKHGQIRPKQERSATKDGIVFSSGFFGFFAHAGFLAALRELKMTPCGYAGSSSGAIVAAMAASGMNDDAIKQLLFKVKKKDFWDPDPWYHIFKEALKCFKGYTGYLKGDGFARLLSGVPVKRIEDCTAPLAVAATDLTHKKETVFTRGNLVRAVQASGAVPMLFKPVEIDGALYADGGIVNKAPLKGLADLVDADRMIVHFIASDNVSGDEPGFLKKRMTPWHIQYLSVNIARKEAYQRQVEMVRRQGIEVVEVRTEAPALGPNSLHIGPSAYKSAKASTLKILKNHNSPAL